MEYKNILLAIEEKIATLTFNRPKVLNAMNLEVLGEIYDAVSACANNDDVRAVIVTAEIKPLWRGRILPRCKTPRPWKSSSLWRRDTKPCG